MTSQKSKMGHIYLSWTSSEQILSKIREPFLVTKINKFRTLYRIFFSTFGGKFSTSVKFCFWNPDLRVCQISAQIKEVDNFPLWWKIFHFQKVPKKKFLFQNHMNWNILHRWLFSDKSENFPLSRFWPKFRNFIVLAPQMCQVSAKLKRLLFS